LSTKKKNFAWAWVRCNLRLALGILFNLAGIPGLIKDCDYEAGVADARIKVRVRDLFTIIEVNGLEIYFHRLTGAIDGVGAMCDCKQGATPQLGYFPELAGIVVHQEQAPTKIESERL
jgi:hypothetical protein